jgi:uncharacterized membrane protein
LFKWAIVCFSISVILAMISILLRTGLNYKSYLSLFNTLALGIVLTLVASMSISMAGLIKERYRRIPYLILMSVNVLFFIWILLE